MMSKIPLLYDTFNARYLTFQQVADSFVKNHYFNELMQNNHSLLMGPRGCGKTTLLKMLTPPALKVWDEKYKSNVFQEIPFYAIYIPTDVHWKKQLDQLNKDFRDKDVVKLFAEVTVNINILIALLKTFSFLIKESNAEESSYNRKEVEFSKFLIEEWKIRKPVIPTLDAIELSLLSELGVLNMELRKLKTTQDYQVSYIDFYYLNYFDLITLGCTAFEKFFEEFNNKKWAFCFDELEIAPEWLQMQLLEYLRSRNQKILFKLTTAPIVSLFKEIKENVPSFDASVKNDFSTIKIWTSNQKEFRVWREFCNGLVRSRIKRRFKHKVDPLDIFGTSHLENVVLETFPTRRIANDKFDFEPNTPFWMVFKELAIIDDSFKKFLEDKKIDPNNPTPTLGRQKDEIFRKIKQIVVYRHQFQKLGITKKRSRKVIPLYYGIPLIYELCDGNPRILIGMVDEFLNAATLPDGQLRRLSINEQSRILVDISRKYLSVISSHPDANSDIQGKSVNVSDLLKEIGTYFHNKIAFDKFSMDPPGIFRVTDDINNKLIQLLELALYLGAIVYVDNHDVLSKNGIVNKRFRLSYILSPSLNLLSRELGEVHLVNILSKNIRIKYQSSLF